MGYLANFIVYTLAMVGVMMVALFVFKKSTSCGTKNNGKFLKVIDTMSLGPRKVLYIVAAGDEKFLIAGDSERTSLISKLSSKEKTSDLSDVLKSQEMNYYESPVSELQNKSSYIDKSVVGIKSTQTKPYSSVMKNLAERISQ